MIKQIPMLKHRLEWLDAHPPRETRKQFNAVKDMSRFFKIQRELARRQVFQRDKPYLP